MINSIFFIGNIGKLQVGFKHKKPAKLEENVHVEILPGANEAGDPAGAHKDGENEAKSVTEAPPVNITTTIKQTIEKQGENAFVLNATQSINTKLNATQFTHTKLNVTQSTHNISNATQFTHTKLNATQSTQSNDTQFTNTKLNVTQSTHNISNATQFTHTKLNARSLLNRMLLNLLTLN